jgi:hypothetical protein
MMNGQDGFNIYRHTAPTKGYLQEGQEGEKSNKGAKIFGGVTGQRCRLMETWKTYAQQVFETAVETCLPSANDTSPRSSASRASQRVITLVGKRGRRYGLGMLLVQEQRICSCAGYMDN